MIRGRTPLFGNEHLLEVPREPDETLHDYLVRCQWKLGERVKMLAAARDAQMAIREMEYSRWRRRMVLLALSQPVVAALAYAYLALSDQVIDPLAPWQAGRIALASFAGGMLVLGIAHVLEAAPTWLLSWRRR